MTTCFATLLQEKELEQITVSELCRLTGINRSSFYLHFEDVYDLMEHTERRLSLYSGQIFTESNGPSYDLGQCFVLLFAFIRQNQAFYRAYLRSHAETRLIDGIVPESASVSYRHMIETLGYVDQRELAYHEGFFKAGLTAMVKLWLESGCQETPKQLADILAREYIQNRSFLPLE